MSKKAMTLLEIVMVVVVLGIVASLGIPAYNNIQEEAMAKIDRTNLFAIKSALDIYMMEHDGLPGNLSQIPKRYFDDAYAKIINSPDGWKIRLAQFVLDQADKKMAYAFDFPRSDHSGSHSSGGTSNPPSISLPAPAATSTHSPAASPTTTPSVSGGGIPATQFLADEVVKGDKTLLVDPARQHQDPGSPVVSYGLNAVLRGVSRKDYADNTLYPATTVIIANCDTDLFYGSNYAFRHKTNRPLTSAVSYAQYITKDSIVHSIDQLGNIKDFPKAWGR